MALTISLTLPETTVLKTLADFVGATDHPMADPDDMTSTSAPAPATNVPPASA